MTLRIAKAFAGLATLLREIPDERKWGGTPTTSAGSRDLTEPLDYYLPRRATTEEQILNQISKRARKRRGAMTGEEKLQCRPP